MKIRVPDIRYFGFKEKVYYDINKKYEVLLLDDRVLQWNQLFNQWRVYYYTPNEGLVYTQQVFQRGDILYVTFLHDNNQSGLYICENPNGGQDIFSSFKNVSSFIQTSQLEKIIQTYRQTGYIDQQLIIKVVSQYYWDLSASGSGNKKLVDALNELYLRTYDTPQLQQNYITQVYDSGDTVSYNALQVWTDVDSFKFKYVANKQIKFNILVEEELIHSGSQFKIEQTFVVDNTIDEVRQLNWSLGTSRRRLLLRNIVDQLQGQEIQGIVTTGSDVNLNIAFRGRIYYGNSSNIPETLNDLNNIDFRNYTYTLRTTPRTTYTIVPQQSYNFLWIAIPISYVNVILSTVFSDVQSHNSLWVGGFKVTDWTTFNDVTNNALVPEYIYRVFFLNNPQINSISLQIKAPS